MQRAAVWMSGAELLQPCVFPVERKRYYMATYITAGDKYDHKLNVSLVH